MIEKPGTRPWLLEEMTLADVRLLQPTTAVLPMGATEPHNLHLPYGTDSLEAWHLAWHCCRAANEQGARIVQLPVLPYGTETNLQSFPLAMNLQPSTVSLVLRDLVESLEHSGICKLVILNSHGGNDLKPVLRELYGRSSVQIFLCNWYQMIRDIANQICEHSDDHAGEIETSLILQFRPELVKKSADGKSLAADSGQQRPMRFEALQKGWVSITRPWHLLTTNSGSGNPHSATPEKGSQLCAAVVERIAPFLVQLSQSEIDSEFPFSNNVDR